MGKKVTPVEFFAQAEVGSLVKYDVGESAMSVRITFIARPDNYACGRDTRRHRKIFLFLSGGMLKEAHRAGFPMVELCE